MTPHLSLCRENSGRHSTKKKGRKARPMPWMCKSQPQKSRTAAEGALPNSLDKASITQHQNQRWYKKGKPPTRTQMQKSSTRQEQTKNPTMCENTHHEPVGFTLGMDGQLNKPLSCQEATKRKRHEYISTNAENAQQNPKLFHDDSQQNKNSGKLCQLDKEHPQNTYSKYHTPC